MKYLDYIIGFKDGILDRCFSPLKHTDFYVSGYKEGSCLRQLFK